MDISRKDLLLLSVCHLLVDGVCAAALFGNSGAALAGAILIYDTCAFTTQCLTGMLPDKYGRGRLFVLLSVLMLAAGALLPVPAVVQAVIIGLGNSLFHVSGGWMTLRGSHTMGPLGTFVAPGAIGLFLGTAFPVLRLPFLAALAVCAAVLAADPAARAAERVAADPGALDAAAGRAEPNACRTTSAEPTAVAGGKTLSDRDRATLAGLLLVAVAARAVGGSVVVFPWKTSLAAGAILVSAVFLGKLCGGFLADREGVRRTAVLSVVLASVLIVFCHTWMAPSILGQFALNLSMPVTLYLIYRLFPDSPGFAFGLAAAALWPGTLAGKLIHLTGVWAGLLAVLCFAAGLAAVLITERRLQK
ncbi:MAG: hypothetical protein IJH91_05415 [Mogibacterium sp.]|nr:hypothetical protein [Mogibacterium sp.]